MVENPGFNIRPEFNPLSILRAVWKHKTFVLVFALLSAAVIGGIVYTLPAVYSSYTLIQVEQQRLPDRFVEDTIQESLEGRLAQLEAQILSYNELLNIIDTYGLYANDRDSMTDEELVLRMHEAIEVKGRSSFTQNENTSAFTVTFEGTEPELVQQVAHQLGQLFIDKNSLNRVNQTTGTAEFLKRRLEKAKTELEVQERLLADYRTRNNGQLPENQNALLSQLSTLQLQVRSLQDDESRLYEKRLRLESDLTQARSLLANLQRLSSQNSASVVGDSPTPANGQQIAVSPAELSLVQSYQRSEAELAGMLTRLTESHPDVRRKKIEVEGLKAQVTKVVEARRNGTPSSAVSPMAPITTSTQQTAAQLSREIAQQEGVIASTLKQIQFAEQQATNMARQRQAAIGEIQGINGRLQGIPLRDAEMTSVLRDYETKRQAYDQMLGKLIEADQAKEMEVLQKSERFSTIERARLPEKPVSPNRPLLMAVGIPACLGLALVLAFVLELKKNVVLGEWELPGGVAVLGRVPPIYQVPAAAGPMGRLPSGAGRGRFWWLNPLAWRASVAVPALLLGVVAVIILTGIRMGWIPL